MFSSEVQALKVGDVVGVSPAHQSRHHPYLVDCVVTKVNGHGHVTCKKGDREFKFDKHGNEQGRSKFSSYYDCLIDNDTAKSRNTAVAEQDAANKRVAAILELISSHKAYSGDYKIPSEVKTKLLEMVAAI